MMEKQTLNNEEVVATPKPSSPITPEENEQLERDFNALLDAYAHTRKGDKKELIRRVFEFAKKAHGDTRRMSGVPYIYHPLAVARIVCEEIGMGSTTISAALLHDVVKDTDVTLDNIKTEFGERIASLVSGLTKISGGNLRFVTEDTSDEKHRAIKNPEEQAENFRNLLLTMSEDVRVILIKIADRLHNMRTLDALAPLKQRRIAGETLYLYAPLAYRLGLFNIKTELEDLSLHYEHPEEYEELKKKLKESEESRDRLFKTFSAPIESMLEGLGLKYSFKARMKSIYSIWRKMKTKHIPFEEVYDLFAARIVFQPVSPESEKTDCWRIYTAITTVYKIHPDRIRDWISRPKSNGYEALHVTVMGPDGNWIEVQIRSERMNEIAEKGFAAHWKYKRGKSADDGSQDMDKWMKTIKEILDNPAPNALDFLDTIKLNLLSSEIYVFTPKGDLQELPKGATALDFAFALHTKIGMHAEVARVNHQLMPLNTKLSSGQQVEILTSDHEKVNEKWRGWVTTAKARGKIQSYLNKQRQSICDDGEKMLKAYLEKNGFQLDNPTMISLLNHFKLQKWDEMFYKIGAGEIAITDQIKNAVKVKKTNLLLGLLGLAKKTQKGAVKAVHNFENKLGGHTKNDNVAKNKANVGETKRPVPVPKTSTIELNGIDGQGVLNNITKAFIDASTANITNVHLECKDGVFKGYITFENNGSVDVNKVCTALKSIHEVEKAVKIN